MICPKINSIRNTHKHTWVGIGDQYHRDQRGLDTRRVGQLGRHHRNCIRVLDMYCHIVGPFGLVVFGNLHTLEGQPCFYRVHRPRSGLFRRLWVISLMTLLMTLKSHLAHDLDRYRDGGVFWRF